MAERRFSKLGIAGAAMITLGLIAMGDGLIAEKHNEDIVNQTYPKLPKDIVEQSKKVQSAAEQKAGRRILQDATSDPNQETWHKNWEEFRLWETSPDISPWLKIAAEKETRKEKLDELNNGRRIDFETYGGEALLISGIAAFAFRKRPTPKVDNP